MSASSGVEAVKPSIDYLGILLLAGAAVYLWHATPDGEYSLYSEGLEEENYLRGVQIADSSGKVTFTSIFPACYTGRWPHIHLEVYPDVDSATDVDNVIATSQVAFPQDMLTQVYDRDEYDGSTRNLEGVGSVEDDGIFADSLDQQLATITGSVSKGYTASLAVHVDTTTEPSAGGGMGGGGGQPPSGGQGGQPPSQG